MNLKRLPGSSRPFTPTYGAKWGPFQWHVAQVLSAYSCGAVADSHRASHYQMEKSYIGEKRQGQEISIEIEFPISNFQFGISLYPSLGST
jgi:hypothetical protein